MQHNKVSLRHSYNGKIDVGADSPQVPKSADVTGVHRPNHPTCFSADSVVSDILRTL